MTNDTARRTKTRVGTMECTGGKSPTGRPTGSSRSIVPLAVVAVVVLALAVTSRPTEATFGHIRSTAGRRVRQRHQLKSSPVTLLPRRRQQQQQQPQSWRRVHPNDNDVDNDVNPTDPSSSDGSMREWSDFDDAELIGSVPTLTPEKAANTTTAATERLIFNDFGDAVLIGGDAERDSSSSSSSSRARAPGILQERIQTVQAIQYRQDAIDSRNWNLGNWNVRGFSLEAAAATSSTATSSSTSGSHAHNDHEDHDGAASSSSGSVRITCLVHQPDGRIATDASSSHVDNDDSDDDDAVVWVGRGDGQVFGVRLGTDYMTALGGDGTDEVMKNDYSVSSTSKTAAGEGGRPNEIVAQLMGSADAIDVMTVVTPDPDSESDDDDDDEPTFVFAASSRGDSVIQQWRLNRSEAVLRSGNPSILAQNVPSPPWWTRTIHGPHHSPIVALQAIQVMTTTGPTKGGGGAPVLVLFVAEGSNISLLNVRSNSWIARVVVTVDDNTLDDDSKSPSSVSSLRVTQSHIYVGTSTGHIVAYDIAAFLLRATVDDETDTRMGATPTTVAIIAAQWRASDNPITALTCGGRGTLGISRPLTPERSAQSTMVLYTGDAKGQVKRWEVLPRHMDTSSYNERQAGVQRLDAWPKLTTQRLPKRAHLFHGHHSGVTAIAAISNVKFASASTDGTVRVWNAVTGKELCCLDGFEEPVRSLCLFDSQIKTADSKNTLIVTDGMNKFVCVHDFSADDQDADYDLEMPEFRT